jgi:ABC-type lipoprotein export system ATPase subunit
MENFNYAKGSEWRKWDLQVQTILDDGYISIGDYWDDLKSRFPDKCNALVQIIGSEENIKKFDSREYFFTDSIDDEKTKSKNYAKLFLNFVEIFNDLSGAICITDHNYDHSYLIDAMVEEAKKHSVKIIPGVEINIQGVHVLVVWGKCSYKQKTYSESIKSFLTKINIHNKNNNGALSVSDKSYAEVINYVKETGGLIIYPHCNSSNGLFQERGKTDRTQLADNFNYQEFNILQSKNKKSADSVTDVIKNKLQTLKSGFVFTLGSDARSLKNVLQADEDGNFCWIKADPTFNGLIQITFNSVKDSNGRVFIGKEPDIVSKVRENKTKYIESLNIDKTDSYNDEKGIWFDNVKVVFNKELVAIIGNKGSGKSAITDIIGLLGNSKNYKYFSFLNDKKFKKNKLATNFFGELSWEDKSLVKDNLSNESDLNSIEVIKYLPQNYFEILCGDIDNKDFQKEVEQVVFDHLDDNEKFTKSSFQDLIDYKTDNAKKSIQEMLNSLNEINKEIYRLEVKRNPKYRNELKSKLEQKQGEIKAHESNKPKEVKISTSDEQSQKEQFEKIKKLNADITNIRALIDKEKIKEKNTLNEIEGLIHIAESLNVQKDNINKFINDNRVIFERYDLDIDSIIQIKLDAKIVVNKIKEKNLALNEVRAKFLSEDEIVVLDIDETEKDKKRNESLELQMLKIKSEVYQLQNQLNEKAKEYQDYLNKIDAWKQKKDSLVGNKYSQGTLSYLQNDLSYIETELHAELKKLRDSRLNLSLLIYKKKKEVIEIYQKVKKSIDDIIGEKGYLLKDYQINVEAGFNLSPDFFNKFFNFINQTSAGTFRSVDGGNKKIREIFDGRNLNEEGDIKNILSDVISYLEKDKRDGEGDADRYIDDQVKDINNFYNYLFSLDYLEEKYKLRLGKKDLDELSPGERGALLLVFYLMLDKNDIPLVIDQPEDNLDNQSVAQILVPFIREAKIKRQIIMVTHNPNLAIVADAEQIIYVEINKESGNNIFKFVSGSIENPLLNKYVVDVLEGTMFAFDQRRLKYMKEEVLE